MEEEVTKEGELVCGDSSGNKMELNHTLVQDKGEKHDEVNKFKEQEDQLDSTCESILSSINEECIKISREKENGTEENSLNSIDGNAESSITSDDKNESNGNEPSEDSDSHKDEDEVEYDHLLSSEDKTNDKTDGKEVQELNENVTSNSSTDNLKVNTSDFVNMDCSYDDSSENVKEREKFEDHNSETKNEEDDGSEDRDLKTNNENKIKLSVNSSSLIEPSNKSVGGIKICSSIFSKDSSNSNDEEEMPDKSESESKEKENSSGKIKLRSFASLCGSEIHDVSENDCNDSSCKSDGLGPMTNLFSSEISGVAVGDIVQHSNIVESDESGVMHLKISNVVGGEDCITGLAMDDERETLLPIQISSIASLIEPVSPDAASCEKGVNDCIINTNGGSTMQNENVDSQQWMLDSSKAIDGSNSIQANADDSKLKSICSPNSELSADKDKAFQTVVNIFKSPIVVSHSCEICSKQLKCEYRVVLRNLTENKVSFICSENCKTTFITNLPKESKIVKPRIYFERICGMCGKELSGLSKSSTYSWQTREFCNKLCLADHIGEVARTCFCCLSPVRVIYMVKYCVRFGSDVHQFCSNNCLESFKSTIKVCSFCQKNLTDVNKVISPSNKAYCSNKCLKRAQRKDISQQHYKEELDCTVCCKKNVNKYEFIHNGATTWLCSEPCLNVFKYAKQVKSVNCCLCARLLNAEESCIYFFNGKKQLGLRVFCTESCFSVFVISARKIVTCEYCKVKKYNFDMICSTSESLEEYYSCSVCCLNFIENQSKNSLAIQAPTDLVTLKAVPENESSLASTLNVVNSNNAGVAAQPNSGASPVMKECNMCSKLEPAQFHMVMSDSTLRSFCSYICATRFKCTFGFQVSGGGISLNANKEELLKLKKDTMSGTDDIEKEDGASIKPLAKIDQKTITNILSLFNPPVLNNKSTMCRPLVNTKGVQCKPHQWHKEVQTEEFPERSTILPIPIPVYVPTPMMMFSAPTPVPLIIPIPVPIPVFIPTTEKTTKDLEKRIKDILDQLPSNPAEAEMLMLAGNEVTKEKKVDSVLTVESDSVLTVENDSMQTDEPTEDEEAETDIEMISRIQNTLSKFIRTQSVEKDNEKSESSKRKHNSEDMEEAPTLKKSKYDEDHLDLSYGVAVWSAWAKRKISEDPSDETQLLQEDLCNMSCDALDHCLILFLEDLSLQKEMKFDIDTIFYLLLGIQKHIFEQGSTFCIFLELNFDKFTSAFDEMVKTFYASHCQPDPSLSRCLLGTRVTEEMLWEARQLGAHTPHVLLNTLFYFNTKVFRLKEAEDHFNLSFTQILKEWKRTKIASDISLTQTSLLKYSPKNKGGNKSLTNPSYEMLENKENPLRCPVKLFEFYLSKCPDSIRNDSSTYYVYPERTCQPDSPVWFSNSSLQIKTIEKMLNRVLLVREVQESLFGSST